MSTLVQDYARQARDAAVGDHWSGPPQLVERAARVAGTRRGHVVVDAGCGVGGPGGRLAGLGCRVFGIDLVASVLAEARARATPSLRLSVADFLHMPFREGIADQVWALGSVAHALDLGAFARECGRVLHPGGRLVVTEAFWDGRRPPRFRQLHPRRALTIRELRAALGTEGFNRIRALPWPAADVPGAMDARDPALAADLADGRLSAALVIADLRS